jgi:hypothetical protein
MTSTPAGAAEPGRGGGRRVAERRAGPAPWLGWGGLGLTALLGLVTSGVSGLLSITGVYVLVVALVALVRGHVHWARIRGRAAGGAALGAALILSIAGGATATPTDEPPSARGAAPSSETTPATPTSAPTPGAPTTSPPPPPPSPLPSPPATASAAATATPTPTPTATPTPTPTQVPPSTPSPATPTAKPRTAGKGTALAAVAGLVVKGRAPRAGYDRKEFGQAWYDADRNGCDTRNDVLRRDLERFTLKAGTSGCLVLGGTLMSPYTGDVLTFVRGSGTSGAVQVDHVVALSDAWQKGAQQLDAARRRAFANDPLNLLAVEGATNAAKGDGDAATWLPPQKSFRCAYVARQVAVKRTYGLWVTAAEREAIERVLRTCPTQRLPAATAIPLGGGKVVPLAPKPRPTATRSPSGLDPHFGTCREANDAGYGPYVEGDDPEYDWYRDRDRDGIVCES